jgi:hypothetical protein
MVYYTVKESARECHDYATLCLFLWLAHMWHPLARLYEYTHVTLRNRGKDETCYGNKGLIYGCAIKHRKEKKYQ